VADPEDPRPLPPISVEAPTVRVALSVNDSPAAGREGRYLTSRVLRERLDRELERNVALRVEETERPDTLLVSGRGELHLAILFETMRREGYEFAIGRPEVIVKDLDGVRSEPFEDAYVDVDESYVGPVVESMGRRRGQMVDMRAGAEDGLTSLVFRVPTRGLLGFRTRFLTSTAGTGVLHTLFAGYGPWAGDIETREHGSLVAWEAGTTTSYALNTAQERGVLFVGPGEDVYGGQIVGRRPQAGDLPINVCRRKHVTNHRRSFAEEGIILTPPVRPGLDEALEYIAADELVEVTPEGVRLRKRVLDTELRQKAAKRSA
jgi:GTP-binding protein